jgi:polar amino acid transport system substrate-binding protein
MKIIYPMFFNLILLPINTFAADNIKIAYYENFPPFSFYENKKLKGIFVDTMEILFKKSKNINIYSEGFPWQRAQELVRKGQFDSHITLTTQEREKYLYHTSNPVFEDQLVLVYLSTNPKANFIKNIKEKNEVKQYIIDEYIGNGLSKSIYSENDGYKLDYSANLKTCFLKLANGRGDIIITNKTNANIYQLQLNGKKLKYIDLSFIKNPLKYYFFLRKSYPNSKKIINYIDKILAQKISQNLVNKNYRKYILKNKIKIDNFNEKIK